MSKKAPRLNRKKGLYLKQVPGKGRGVFCDTAIKKGEILETTPALIINEKETTHVDKTRLVDYTFGADGISKEIRKRKKIKDPSLASCVIYGVTTFCNHDEKPNAQVIWEEHNGTAYHSLKATRNIPANTEICTSYGEGWFEDRQ